MFILNMKQPSWNWTLWTLCKSWVSSFYLNNILFVPTGNAYFLITVTFGHINMADADGRWGSQKKTQNFGHRREKGKRPSPGINLSEKNENLSFYIWEFTNHLKAQRESFFKHYTRPHISFYKIISKHSFQHQEHQSINRWNRNKKHNRW